MSTNTKWVGLTAFPQNSDWDDPGMDHFDYLAAKAMAAIIASDKSDIWPDPIDTALRADEYAHAMMLVRDDEGNEAKAGAPKLAPGRGEMRGWRPGSVQALNIVAKDNADEESREALLRRLDESGERNAALHKQVAECQKIIARMRESLTHLQQEAGNADDEEKDTAAGSQEPRE